MSNFLAIDTSSRYLTVVAQKGARKLVNHVADCAMNHSVVLMGEIDRALKALDLNPADCDFFVAVTGPGSFTGIRIGIASIKGFAAATGKKALGVTVFDMLSYNIISEQDYIVAVDAAHGNYYACGYSADGTENMSPCFLSEQQLIALNKPIYGFEDLRLPSYAKLNVKDCLYPAVIKCKKDDVGVYALYVKKSQAEEERAARGGGV